MANSNRPMTNCPKCGVRVRVDRLSRHLRKVHSTKPRSPVRPWVRRSEVNPRPKTHSAAKPRRAYRHKNLRGQARYNMDPVNIGGQYWVDEHGMVQGYKTREESSPAPTPRNQQDVSPLATGQRTVNWVVCPECHRTIKKDLLKNHIRSAHTQKVKPDIAQQAGFSRQVDQGSPSRVARILTTCPVCQCRVREDRLKKHLSRVHRQSS
jgi:hypothetical protein